MAPRSTRAVLESHLECRQAGQLEEDLEQNYADDVVMMSAEGVDRGHDAVRQRADVLKSYVPAGVYRYHHLLVDGDVGMLHWTATSEEVRVHDGADTFVVKDGLIVAQTIHYSVRED